MKFSTGHGGGSNQAIELGLSLQPTKESGLESIYGGWTCLKHYLTHNILF